MSITSTTQTETHIDLQVPVDPWNFARAIEKSQWTEKLSNRHSILFNKGRYFETSIYDKELIEKVSEMTGLKIQYTNMIVGSWKQLEDFVIAMNICDYEVKINVDWV